MREKRSNLGDAIDELRARSRLASAAPWVVESDGEGPPFIRTGRPRGEQRLFLRRDLESAHPHDLAFVALARNVVDRLLASWANAAAPSISPAELDEIEKVAAKASPGPWRAFIEETQPIGGCSVIWPGDEEGDIYVWLGDDIAPAADIEFIAHAREDVPRLAAALRSRDGS